MGPILEGAGLGLPAPTGSCGCSALRGSQALWERSPMDQTRSLLWSTAHFRKRAPPGPVPKLAFLKDSPRLQVWISAGPRPGLGPFYFFELLRRLCSFYREVQPEHRNSCFHLLSATDSLCGPWAKPSCSLSLTLPFCKMGIPIAYCWAAVRGGGLITTC